MKSIDLTCLVDPAAGLDFIDLVAGKAIYCHIVQVAY